MRAAPAALVCVAVAVALLVFGRGPARHNVTAEFSDVRGLVSGAQVRLAGVPVGDVERIWLGPDGWPRVRMAIDDGITVNRAAVRLASLSGEFNRYVSVVQGSGPGAALIPRSRTTSPVEVDDALGTFDPSTRAALRGVLGGLRGALTGQGGAIAATLRESQAALSQVAALAGDIGGDGAALGQALRSVHIVAATLSIRTPAINAAVDGSAQVLRTVAARAATVSAGLAGSPRALGAAQTTLTQARALIAPVSRLVSQAAPAVAELPAASAEMRSALLTARPVLRRAAGIAQAAPGAARVLMPLLGAARPLLALMVPVLGRIGPMLDQLRVRLPDAFSFFANWADFTSNYDANGHAARVGIVLPPAPLNPLDPAGDGPGQLKAPYLRVPGSLEGEPWSDYSKSFVAGGKP